MENQRLAHLAGIAMLLGLFIPHTSFYLMALNPIMVFLLYFIARKKNKPSLGTFRLMIILIVIISLFSSIVFLSHSSSKYIYASLFFILLMVCFPLMGREKIPGAYYFFSLGLILFSQLVYLVNAPSVQSLIETFYPVGETEFDYYEYMTQNIDYQSVLSFRLGGLFRNANHTARYVCLITGVYLADRPNDGLRRISFISVIALVSVVLSGSRTGLVVILLIIGVFILRNHSISRRVKAFIFAATVIALIPFFIHGSSLVRGFNINQGYYDSANVKWSVFLDYLTQDNSFFHLLFGYSDPRTFSPSSYGIMSIFDSEYGDMVYCYGFLGFIFVCLFYLKSLKLCKKENRVFFFFLLWSITSTVLLSYRSSFLFMLFLSHFLAVKREPLLR